MMTPICANRVRTHHRCTQVPVVEVGAEPEAARSRAPRLSLQPVPKFPVHKARLSTLVCPVYHIGEAIYNLIESLRRKLDRLNIFVIFASFFFDSRSFPGSVSYSRESTPDSGGSHPYLEAYHRDTAGE